MALIGIGLERLSITPAAIGPVKAMVRSLDTAALRTAMAGWLASPPANMRATLQDWAAANDIVIG
jgi:phosphotransferase system enzyme I (PtsP)